MNNQKRAIFHIVGPTHRTDDLLTAIDSSPGIPYKVLDLSVGSLMRPSSLTQEAGEFAEKWGEDVWIEGQQFAPQYGDATREEYITWLSQRADETILGRWSIKQWFTFKDMVSLWWFTPMSCKNAETHPYRWLIYMWAVIHHVINDSGASYTTVRCWVEDERIGQVLHQVARQATGDSVKVETYQVSDRGAVELKCDCPAESHSLLDGLSRLFISIKIFIRTVYLYTVRLPRRRSEQKEVMDATEKPLIIMQSYFPKSWRAVSEIDERVDESAEYVDHYFGDAPWRVRQAGFRVAWLPKMPFSSYDDWVEQSRSSEIADASPWMSVTLFDIVQLLWHQLTWLVLFVWLFNVKRVHEAWTYKGVSFGDWLIEEYGEMCVGGTGLLMLLDIMATRRACSTLEPECLLYRDEFYRSGRQITVAASGVAQTVATQHGVLNREHTVYQFAARDVPDYSGEDTKGLDFVKHCPMPTQFLAFGEYVVEQFKDWDGYMPRDVVPVGGLRHDGIVWHFQVGAQAPDRRGRQRQLRGQLELPNDKSVVLVCPGREEEAGHYFDLVLSALRRVDADAFVAVKLHQFHGGRAQIEQAANQRDFDSYAIYDQHIYKLLFASDVLIAGMSTLTVEAHLASTPVVAITPHPEYELYPFSEENIAKPVSTVSEMTHALRVCMNMREQSMELNQRGRVALLQRHLNNADMDAGSRLVDFLRRQSI